MVEGLLKVNLDLIIPTMRGGDATECIASWDFASPLVIDNTEKNLGVVGSYQQGYKMSPANILVFAHDDVIIREPWQERVLAEFQDPTVGLVGFGGAAGHCSSDLYRVPYRMQNMGRIGYRSNVDDAEIHGERFDGCCDVAVLDGFTLAVRREVLDLAGGWPVGTPVDYSCYDYWLGCETHRQGYRIRLVGIRCHHLGGRTAVRLNLAGSGKEHEDAHRWIYARYRDVLPWVA